MIFLAIIIGLIIIGLVCFINHMSSNDLGNMDMGVTSGIVLSIFCVMEIGVIIDITNEPELTPMDVYQGKTTLEYTIRDGIKVDSVVVWKGGIENEN